MPIVSGVNSRVAGRDLRQSGKHDRLRRREPGLDMVAVRFICEPGIGGKDKIRLDHADVFEKVTAQSKIIILTGIRISKPNLFFYPDDLACSKLVALQCLR